MREERKHGVILEGLKHVNEWVPSYSRAIELLKNAPSGSEARGGGYGPYVKLRSGGWKEKSNGTLFSSQSLGEFIGGFTDFKLDTKGLPPDHVL